jgi:hypothetical protein
LQDVELVRDILERLIEATQQLEKCGDRPHRQRSQLDAPRAGDDEDRERHGRQDLDRREIQRVVRDRAELHVQMFAIEALELRAFRALHPE